MSRSVVEIISILINLEENFVRIYKNIASIDGQYDPKLKTIASILQRQEQEHVKRYRGLYEEYKEDKDNVISEEAYVTASNLLLSFRKNIEHKSHNEVKELLQYVIKYEKANGEALQTILDSIDQDYEGHVKLKNLLETLIKAEKQHALTLEKFV